MARKRIMPWEEPHVGIRFGDEADPDCFVGPFFLVELHGGEIRGYRTAPCEGASFEVVARWSVLGEEDRATWGWAPVYGGETSEKEWFDEIDIYTVCGKKTEHGPCQNPLGSEDCRHEA